MHAFLFSAQGWKTMCTVPLVVSGALDYETSTSHAIVVRATDSHNLFKTATYTIRIVDVNDPPRGISLSNSAVVENQNGATVGTFQTTDDDSGDSHTYKLRNSAGGRFVLVGATLKTASNANLNHETGSQYTIVVQSTDSGSRSIERSFVIRVTDENETPGVVALPSSTLAENSPQGTKVGTLSVSDPDNEVSSRQRVTLTLINSAGGRFRIVNNDLQVAISNARCLAMGGSECKLNYETARSYKIVVRATDNGSPALSRDTTLTVYLTDANDQPRNLVIDKYKVNEKAAIGTVIGTLSASDEDAGQIFSYQLTNSDGGRFTLKGAQLVKAKLLDFETKKFHSVTVKVTDSGSPKKSVS